MWCKNTHLPLQFQAVARRSYDQPECGLAVALDLIGERWTLLIVRELLFGPQRYTDLSGALSGLSTNLLAGRLRHLEAAGVVHRRELPPPAASQVYELTPVGLELEPLVVQLAQWGARFTQCSAITDPRTAAFALVAHQEQWTGATGDNPGALVDTGECRIDIDEFSIAAHLEQGRLRTRPYAPDAPVAVMRTSGEVYFALVAGELSWTDAVETHIIDVEGDMTQLGAVFGRLR